MKRIVLLLGCLAWMPAQAGELYRWVDERGKVHYGDTPPADAVRVQAIKLSDSIVPGAELPYETRRAQQNFPVILYVADNCGAPCDDARSLLDKRGIPYSEKKLVTQEDIDAFKALSGSGSAPTLAVGRLFLTGFQATEWNRELDFAGYPKTPPYRAPLPPAPAPSPAPKPAPDNTEPAEPESSAEPEPLPDQEAPGSPDAQ